MNTKLYVGNLSFKASEDELNSLFSEHGTVTDIFIVKDKFTDRSKGLCFCDHGHTGGSSECNRAIE